MSTMARPRTTGPRAIGTILADLAASARDRPAVTCEGRTLTWGELESRSNRLARAYEQLGVSQGDLVTVALPNGIEFYESSFAIWKLGACPVPVSSRSTERERQRVVDLAGSPLVVGVPAGETGGTADRPGAVSVAADRPTVPPGFEPDPSLSDAPLDVRISPTWRALTSGGSTGDPKLIVSSTPSELDPAVFIQQGFHHDQVQLVAGPLYHSMSFTVSMTGALMGHHLVVLPRFDAEQALRAIHDYRVNYLAAVPTMLLRMARILDAEPGRYDLGSIEGLLHSGARCPDWLKERWIDLVGGDRVFETYGGTEFQAATWITGTEWLEHRGSVGRVFLGAMKVVDPEGNDLPPGEVGEIYMRPQPGVPDPYRYVGAEARTLDDGWESLGDLGSIDAEGYVYLADRRIDMLVSGGANVYPAEVESAIVEHPDVLSCVVVGLPDDDLGQRVHAVVQIARVGLTDDDLRAFLSERLVRYKTPRSFRFVREPLRNDADKVRRAAILEQEIEIMRRQFVDP